MIQYLDLLNGLLSPQLNGRTAIVRLVLAMLMSGALGLERTRKLRPAGLRTYMLVCIGACTVTMAGIFVNQNYVPGADPARMAAQVVSGIGFIGAGTIIVTGRQKIKGLTTAAGLWATACLGIVLGVGFVTLAFGTFCVMLVVMISADRLEQWYSQRLCRFSINLIMESPGVLKQIDRELSRENITLGSVEIRDTLDHVGISVSGVVRTASRISHEELIRKISDMDGVFFAEQE